MRHPIIKSLLGAALVSAVVFPAFAQEKVVLTMWHNHPEWKDRVEPILARFEELHANIDIQLDEHYYSYCACCD